jgi:hypothetical protein
VPPFRFEAASLMDHILMNVARAHLAPRKLSGRRNNKRVEELLPARPVGWGVSRAFLLLRHLPAAEDDGLAGLHFVERYS